MVGLMNGGDLKCIEAKDVVEYWIQYPQHLDILDIELLPAYNQEVYEVLCTYFPAKNKYLGLTDKIRSFL